MDEILYWYWIVNIKGIGKKTIQLLLEQYKNPNNLWHTDSEDLSKILTPKKLEQFINSRNMDLVKNGYERLYQEKINFITQTDPRYPEKLKQIPAAPLALYVKGNLPADDHPILAVVGSRTPSPYGIQVSKHFVKEIALSGISIVSGLASGIDGIAHRTALDYHAYTLGVIGGGIDSMYPRENFNLYMDMYERGGVISEYDIGFPNSAGLFPERNRIISGISDGVLICEAAARSGTLITADHALEQGKDIYVIPGRITDPLSRGCNHLIMQGANLAECPDDIIEDISERFMLQQNEQKNQISFSFEDKEEEIIYHYLDPLTPRSPNEILLYFNNTKSIKSYMKMNDLLGKLLMM